MIESFRYSTDPVVILHYMTEYPRRWDTESRLCKHEGARQIHVPDTARARGGLATYRFQCMLNRGHTGPHTQAWSNGAESAGVPFPEKPSRRSEVVGWWFND